jgi:predicted DNA-binding transcriptional regulator
MVDVPPKEAGNALDASLKGTTLRVYRYMLKRGSPLGVSDIQKGLGLSSPSVAQYHIRKLQGLGLVSEKQGGYVVDRVIFENIVRIRRTAIPTQSAYVAFFTATLLILLASFRPTVLSSIYVYALIINIAALGASIFETVKTTKRL